MSPPSPSFLLLLLLLLLSCSSSVLSGNVVSNTDPITHKPFYSSGAYAAAWDQAQMDSLPLCRDDMVHTHNPTPPHTHGMRCR